MSERDDAAGAAATYIIIAIALLAILATWLILQA